MNSVERILAAAALKPVDQTPVLPVMLMQGARMLRLRLTEYFGNPTRMAEGQLRLVERFGHDGVFAFPHIVQDILPWGSDIDFHEDGPPTAQKMVIDRFEEIASLRVPDPTAHPYLRKTLDAATALARAVKGEKLIVGAVIGPFSLPSMLMGTRKAVALLVDPEARTRYLPVLMSKMIEYTSRWGRAQLAAGCDLVVVAEGMASATIIDKDTFLRDARPVLQEFVQRTGGLLALEFVGHALPYLPHVRDLGVAAFLIGGSDPVDQARRAIGSQKALVGNLNNLKLLRWEPERVQFEARRVIAAAGPGFILSNQGPEIPWEVPDASIDALIRARSSS